MNDGRQPGRRPGHPAPKAPTEYRKPKRINAVSLTLAAIAAAAVYAIVALWPVYTLRAGVRAELDDALPQLYRMNLRPENLARPDIAKLKKSLTERVIKAGVKDKKLVVDFIRDKKRVAIEARFTASMKWPGLSKQSVFHLAPRAETDAARVEWE